MRISWKQIGAMLVVATAILGVLPPARGADRNRETICQLCGMDAARSETEFVLHREAAPDRHACCINCARRLMKKLGVEAAQVTALDYRTRKHVAAAKAFYVLGSARIPKGSMAPFVFAFGSRENADAFKERNGGEVLVFAAILEKLEAGQAGTHGH